MGDRWPLTGRCEELRLITDALADGECRGVAIAGRAGVGKTRLAREVADGLAAAGWAVARLAGTATGRSVPLGAFAGWIDDFDANPLAMAHQVITALTARAGAARLLVVVDDVHLLDDLSALAVHQLVNHEVATVVATVRTAEPSADAVSLLWKDRVLRRIELQPLSQPESEALLVSVLGAVSPDCAHRMWKLTRGNVLFLRHLVEQELAAGRLVSAEGQLHWMTGLSVSPTLVELVEAQIGAVPGDVRDVVDLVAVAEPVERSCLESLAGVRAVEAAEERGLIRATPEADLVYVGHPLYGEIRLEQCGGLRLRRLRGELATLMARDPSRVDPLRLGMLWLDSDLPPDVAVLSRAAGIARSRLDLPLAERFARAALAAGTDPPAVVALAYVLFLQEKGAETERLLDSLDLPEPHDDHLVTPAVLRAANLLWVLRRPDESRAVIDAALERGDPGAQRHLRAFRAVQLVLAAHPAAALDALSRIDIGRLDPFGQTLARCAEVIAFGDLGRTDEAVRSAAAGYAVVAASPQDGFQGTGLSEFHAFALLAAGHVGDALAIARERHRLCAKLPGMVSAMASALLGMTALGGGDLPTALRCFDTAAAGIGSYGEVSGIYYRFKISATEALARSGQVDAAVAALAQLTDTRHPAYDYVESGRLLATAWVAAARGRAGEARAAAAEAAEFAARHGQPAREVLCLQAAVQLGDVTVAGRLAELAALVDGPRAGIAARYGAALADGDAHGLEAASCEFEASGDRLAAADAAAQAAAVYRQSGLRGSALTAAGRAGRLAQDCGGAVSPALLAASVTLPLTEREREIALLVARGLSNRDIAQAMSLSVRTVEGHIYRATVKAGVTTRAELSSAVAQYPRLPVSG
ncbi:LuxR family transcriptional regulator [Mycolicibacterium insubricum]|uniref:Helix-turn-helix transcriptional regulator n=2 Tax=Mycolicibacterium insubricum TaxID=444597 RepID=A0A1X0DL31_9MYCO|nr:LuxR family transcriptional regulator [Mycolicibacterium insubricum]MCB9440034.1 AAA family ATPase [Mycolicibacterium sp.]ORA72849.1 helix-turn-helix transcriptional regulator [Mycolicibacterium insubricum]BBZ66537.1 LuxR family transcriptional regulator [Mycolicibacterium insubricum]